MARHFVIPGHGAQWFISANGNGFGKTSASSQRRITPCPSAPHPGLESPGRTDKLLPRTRDVGPGKPPTTCRSGLPELQGRCRLPTVHWVWLSAHPYQCPLHPVSPPPSAHSTQWPISVHPNQCSLHPAFTPPSACRLQPRLVAPTKMPYDLVSRTAPRTYPHPHKMM